MNLEQTKWVQELKSKPNNQVIDVRTIEEYNHGHIPNATLIDIKQAESFLNKIHKLDKTKNYFVYCKAGIRGAKACDLMNKLNLNCYNLMGGIEKWEGSLYYPK